MFSIDKPSSMMPTKALKMNDDGSYIRVHLRKTNEFYCPMLPDTRSKNVGSGVDHYILTDIDDFQAADDRREAALNAGNAPQAASAAQDMANIIRAIDGNLSRVRCQELLRWASHLKRLPWRLAFVVTPCGGGRVTETL